MLTSINIQSEEPEPYASIRSLDHEPKMYKEYLQKIIYKAIAKTKASNNAMTLTLSFPPAPVNLT